MPVTLEEAAAVYGLKDRELLKLADPNKRVDHAIVELQGRFPRAFTDYRKATNADANEAWKNMESLRHRIDYEVQNDRALAAMAVKYGDNK